MNPETEVAFRMLFYLVGISADFDGMGQNYLSRLLLRILVAALIFPLALP
jgi:hypothetical protein